MTKTGSHGRQMLGSLLAALALVTAVVLLVAWRIGPDGVASRGREEVLDERTDAAEDPADEAGDARDERGGRGRGRGGRDR